MFHFKEQTSRRSPRRSGAVAREGCREDKARPRKTIRQRQIRPDLFASIYHCERRSPSVSSHSWIQVSFARDDLSKSDQEQACRDVLNACSILQGDPYLSSGIITIMYGVVAKWEFEPKDEQELSRVSNLMMDELRALDGVETVLDIRVAPNAILSVITYRDEATYQALIHDPNGPFVQAAAKHGIEDLATWVWSERGEVI